MAIVRPYYSPRFVTSIGRTDLMLRKGAFNPTPASYLLESAGTNE